MHHSSSKQLPYECIYGKDTGIKKKDKVRQYAGVGVRKERKGKNKYDEQFDKKSEEEFEILF